MQGQNFKLVRMCMRETLDLSIYLYIMLLAFTIAHTLCLDVFLCFPSLIRVRAKAAAGDTSVETCNFFEEYSNRGSDSVVPSGIYSLDDLKTLGQEQGWCPYFLARHVINHAKVSHWTPNTYGGCCIHC
jgi:hypothetical protein